MYLWDIGQLYYSCSSCIAAGAGRTYVKAKLFAGKQRHRPHPCTPLPQRCKLRCQLSRVYESSRGVPGVFGPRTQVQLLAQIAGKVQRIVATLKRRPQVSSAWEATAVADKKIPAEADGDGRAGHRGRLPRPPGLLRVPLDPLHTCRGTHQ